MSKSECGRDVRELLLRMLDEAFDRQAWHGPNLRGAVRRVSAKQAVWRPKSSKRNIAEIVVHCAYWKYAVRRRILGGKRGSFPLKGSNWFALSQRSTDRQWKEYVALLDEQHLALREAMATAPWSALCEKNSTQPAGHVYGIVMHDTYHAGQIRTLKAMFERAKGKR